MQTFMAQEPRWVASFIHACEQRAQDDPPDAVVFGDPVEGSYEISDCSEGGDDVDVFEHLDRVLASEVFPRYPVSLWFPCGLHGFAVPDSLTVSERHDLCCGWAVTSWAL
jgi:hypothetical protein